MNDAQAAAKLEATQALLVKALAELNAALHPPVRSFAITALRGVFSDDAGLSVGDVAHVVVLRGRVGQLSADGIWGDIAPDTVVEYWVTHSGVDTNKAIESFYVG